MNEFGLIGSSLAHSFSKKYFTEKFEREGLSDCRFELFPLEFIGDLSVLLRDHPNLKGLAVTIPYKEQVFRFLTSIDEVAQKIGAVNCIRITDTHRIGFNTDITGFESSFTPLLKPHQNKALVLGDGGASRTVQFVLNKMGIDFRVVTRKIILPGQMLYEEVTAGIVKEFTVIINCTPLGMYPDIDSRPALPYDSLSANNYLFDLVYNPDETLFLKEGIRHGAVVKNGMEMLQIQAEENWRIWNTPL